jgi:flagellar FliL protein
MEMAAAQNTERRGEEPGEQPEAQPAGEKKKGLPKVILIALALVLLGGGGFGAKKFVLSGSKGAEHKKEAKKEVKEPGPILDLGDEFIINLNGGGYARTKIAVELGAEVKGGGEGRGGAELMAPMRDLVITVLSSKSRFELTSAEGKESTKKELIDRINKKFAARGQDGLVQEVYFTSLAVQQPGVPAQLHRGCSFAAHRRSPAEGDACRTTLSCSPNKRRRMKRQDGGDSLTGRDRSSPLVAIH